MTNHELLKKTFLFNNCTDEEIELAMGLFQERSVRDSTMIFTEKMPAEALYIVKSGGVRISLMAGEGREVDLLVLKPGEFFGEVALIQGDGRLASARSTGATELLMLTRKEFQAMLDLEPRLGSKILMAIALLLASRIRVYGDRFKHLLTA